MDKVARCRYHPSHRGWLAVREEMKMKMKMEEERLPLWIVLLGERNCEGCFVASLRL